MASSARSAGGARTGACWWRGRTRPRVPTRTSTTRSCGSRVRGWEPGYTPVELADIAASQGGGFALNGASEQDLSGRSVSGAGDVDGDGLADLLVGKIGADPNGEYSGQSYVVFSGDFLFA